MLSCRVYLANTTAAGHQSLTDHPLACLTCRLSDLLTSKHFPSVGAASPEAGAGSGSLGARFHRVVRPRSQGASGHQPLQGQPDVSRQSRRTTRSASDVAGPGAGILCRRRRGPGQRIRKRNRERFRNTLGPLWSPGRTATSAHSGVCGSQHFTARGLHELGR